jgi:hypothetical protein
LVSVLTTTTTAIIPDSVSSNSSIPSSSTETYNPDEPRIY